MSAPAKKRPIKGVEVIVNAAKPQKFVLPKSKVKSVLSLLKDYKVEEKTVPWRKASKGLLDQYTEAGAMLKGARLREGLTQVELAKKLNVPQQHISEMEKGKRPIGKNTAKRLAEVFELDYRVFL